MLPSIYNASYIPESTIWSTVHTKAKFSRLCCIHDIELTVREQILCSFIDNCQDCEVCNDRD